jgi:FAD/FMN-containing dehydrogenase
VNGAGARSFVAALRDGFAGEIVLPGDDGYDSARAVWNGMIDRRPAIVVRPAGVADVVTAVRFARDNELLVAVRSGGHSIPGLSTCDGGIVIDLCRMRGAEVDPDRRVAWTNGGALLAELDRAAQSHELVCPVGVVGHTGVAGLTLGGGMGRLQRKLGLTVDNLRSVELVTADGRVVRASDDENTDLFWGMRGAGPNFGIVTRFEFRLHQLGLQVTHGSVAHPVERLDEVAKLFRELAEQGPDELTASLAVGWALPVEEYPPELAGRPVVFLTVLHCGSEDAAARDLGRVHAIGPPVMDTVVRKPYLAAQSINDEALAWGHRFSMKSGFTAALPDGALDLFVANVLRRPGTGDCSVFAWTWGRAIAHLADDATAVAGRHGRFWVSAEAMWDDPTQDAEHRQWVRATLADLSPFLIAGRYVNDVAETGDDVVRSVYGHDKYRRLVQLKRTWDPDNVFSLNQNVRP